MQDKTFDQMPEDQAVEEVKKAMGVGEVQQDKDSNLPALLGGKMVGSPAPATIRGMENHTSEDFQTPTISIIQGTSKAKLIDGSRPQYGSFFFSDTKEERKAIAVCIIHKSVVLFDDIEGRKDDYGNVKKSRFYKLIVVDVNTGRLYQMFLKTWSHAKEWKKLNTDIVNLGAEALWEFPVRMTTEQLRNDNGHEWNVVKMSVSSTPVSDEALVYMDGLYETFAKQQQAPIEEAHPVDSNQEDDQDDSKEVYPSDIPF